MEIKDIVEQEKHKRSLAKIKQREEKLTRKQFLKDCYKFWKEYKKVESPYFWWLSWFSIWNLDETYYLEWCVNSPNDYLKDSWFDKKWCIGIEDMFRISMKRRADPTQKIMYFNY